MQHLNDRHQKHLKNLGSTFIMKLAVVLAILIVGLTVQVKSSSRNISTSSVSIQLQSNGVDAIFWHFIRPFIPGGSIMVSTGSTPSTSGSSSTNGSSSTPVSSTNMSSGALNNSNAIFASNSNVTANINQTFEAASASSSDSASPTPSPSESPSTSESPSPSPSPSPTTWGV